MLQIREHVTVAALNALLRKARELSAAQARDLPASWALSLSTWSWFPRQLSHQQPGEGSGTLGLTERKWRHRSASANETESGGAVDKFTTGTYEGGGVGDKGATGNKGKMLVHIMYCNH